MHTTHWALPFFLSGPSGQQCFKLKADAVVNPRLLQLNHRINTVFGGIDLTMAELD